MAAGSLPKPGTRYGPCLPTCKHLDCDCTRSMAATPCRICKQPIGYDDGTYHSRFYQESAGGQPMVLAHADCAEDEAEGQRLVQIRNDKGGYQ